ncbi:MAG: hypothetical protein Q4G50_06085 [Corynebacterium sp.]|uniref:hypothetical protein n=1 Tax=Corynebacterium sp. TaxID=1720 RepID=UPI0026DF11D9|nr:hypothetical protein [Corynebacterium sp.]MDO5669554.1 hypothetical protein [Corynebacterium sp.]
MNVGRDYIVEYKAGQFQHGSLVLRFDAEPSETQLRAALVDYGLPAKALEEIRARPLGSERVRPAPEQRKPAPVTRASASTSRRGGGVIVIPLIIGLIGFGMLQAEPATDLGQVAGMTASGSSWAHCSDRLDVARAGDDSGIIGSQFSRWPTAFVISPANAAFMVTCLGEAIE